VRTSVFELFKIGMGPSSSHTMGPMRAAREFAVSLSRDGLLARAASIRVELYGSLALTGKGHATDRAILLGLLGETPDGIDLNQIEAKLTAIRNSGSIMLLGLHPVAFLDSRDFVWHRELVLPGHPNAMRFTVLDAAGTVLRSDVYFSPGGGFIRREGDKAASGSERAAVPFPFSSGAEMLAQAKEHSLSIWELMLANERAWNTEEEIRAYLARIWQVMQESSARGLATEGILPGGLNVRRRAPALARRLAERGSKDPLAVMDWVNVWAMAVNEENAAGGRVVTAPTNGASGLIPAVIHYYVRYQEGTDEGVFRFLLTAGAIGVLYKENASISGAEVGCQGEVGVACSMAAAGLSAALGGTSGQVEHSAEIGMEHNLGMTCDPIGGLVQIPCIERNAIGAVKAINASRMAMEETEGHRVQLDQVIRTMYQTGLDMQSRYKETSLAGLAVNAVEC